MTIKDRVLYKLGSKKGQQSTEEAALSLRARVRVLTCIHKGQQGPIYMRPDSRKDMKVSEISICRVNERSWHLIRKWNEWHSMLNAYRHGIRTRQDTDTSDTQNIKKL